MAQGIVAALAWYWVGSIGMGMLRHKRKLVTRMQREILFHGKDIDGSQWYTGSYMTLSDTTYCTEKIMRRIQTTQSTISFLTA